MKTLSEESGLRILEEFRESFRSAIEKGYEHSAKDCVTCDVQGECCTDAHFVNVRISRLDAVAIEKEIESLDKNLRARVLKRVSVTRIAESGTYSCPLFEKGVGCLVHENAKPLPCINHACYERPEDLPPSSLLDGVEERVGRLNDRVYRKTWNWMTIPEWLNHERHEE